MVYEHQRVNIVYSSLHFIFYSYIFFTFSFKSIIMIFTRSQTENMSRDKLVELLKLSYVSSKLSDLTKKFNDFVSKYDKVYSELQISRNWFWFIILILM